MREFDVPTDVIKMEITESIMLEDIEAFMRIFKQFHDAGFSIWIDDFGSAYSSLNVLQNYEFDVMKFDMLFLRNFSVRSRQVLASLVNMAKVLNIHTLVEGVETEEQKDFLQSIGCEALQGYYFSKPVSMTDFASLADSGDVLESREDRDYWNHIGRLNILSPSPLQDFGSAKDTSSVSDLVEKVIAPLALVECFNDRAFYVYVSDGYRKRVLDLGYESIDDLEHAFNEKQSDQYLMIKRLMLNTVSKDSVQELDYTNNGMYYKLSARCIAKKKDCAMLALQLRIFDTDREIKTAKEMLQYGNALFSTYEIVTLVYPSRASSTRIYAADTIPAYDNVGAKTLEESIRKFCEAEIISEDQERYIRFFDLSTLEERIENSERGFIQAVFRLSRKKGAEDRWRTIRISKVPSDEEEYYIYTIQKVHPKEAVMRDSVATEHPEMLE